MFIFLIRALELAIRHKRQLEEVLNARAKYLHTINKNETNQNFLTHIENISMPQLTNEVSNFIKISITFNDFMLLKNIFISGK